MPLTEADLAHILSRRLAGRALRDLLDNLGDGVYLSTPTREIVFWNRGAERITGYRAEEVVGRRCYENILMHTDAGGCRLCLDRCPMEQTIQDEQPRTRRLLLAHRDGRRIPVVAHTIPIHDEQGELVGIAETFSDDSERDDLRGEVARLSQAAATDPLTGLANRRALDDALELAFYRRQRHGHSFGLVLIDLDRFKQVNDHYGHAVGDDLLRAVARAVAEMRRRDELVGRWGGDEFVALAQPVEGIAHLAAVAERLRGVVSGAAVRAAGSLISLTASAGAALARSGEDAQALLGRADRLLYEAKSAGGDRSAIS